MSTTNSPPGDLLGEIGAGMNDAAMDLPRMLEYYSSGRHETSRLGEEGSSMQAAQLANQFGIPNALRFEDGSEGLVRAVISTPAAEAHLYLQGAHVTQWTPRGQRPVLFVS